MKILLFVVLTTLSFSTRAAELLPEEEALLIERVESIGIAYEKGDADKLLELTFPPIVTALGGPEAFKLKIKQALELQVHAGIVIESTTIGKPTVPISAGEYILCFVPKVSVMKMPDKRGKSIGFMIATRDQQGTDWRFMDGAGLRRNPSILKMFFPDLPENLSLPENKLELLP